MSTPCNNETHKICDYCKADVCNYNDLRWKCAICGEQHWICNECLAEVSEPNQKVWLDLTICAEDFAGFKVAKKFMKAK
jgi:hypothetical protein